MQTSDIVVTGTLCAITGCITGILLTIAFLRYLYGNLCGIW